MVDASRIASNVADIIAVVGDNATLAREGEATTVALKARRVGGTVETVGGGTASQQVFRVRVGTVELAASAWTVKAPRRGDRLTLDGRTRTVSDARPVKVAGVVGLYELEVAG